MGEFDHISAAMRESPVIKAFTEMSIAGDFSALEKNQAKRHHFLPQLLQRKFSFLHEGKEGIFQMKASGRAAPRRVGLRQAASRNRLYTVLGEDGELSNRHEGYLELIERHAAPALTSLLEDPDALSPGQRATIALFIAVQMMRTPDAVAQVNAIPDRFSERHVGNGL